MSEIESQYDRVWGKQFRQLDILARNVSMNYLALGFDVLIGLLMLPFNISHLGQSTYGLWALVASVTAYFSMLDLGYGVSQVKFAAQYRARRDREGLNQIVSTLFVLFSIIGLAAFAAGALVALNLSHFFNVSPEQADIGRKVLLIISAYVALGFPASVFGGVVNGFQRHYLNGFVSIATSCTVALVNVVMLLTGHGLVELVAATTAVRILSYLAYAATAYRAYPGLRLRISNVRIGRLKEVTGFSAFILLIDLANKLNYSTDAIVVGAFIGTIAVAIWSVAQRIIDTTQTLTGQLTGAMFPIVVDSATAGSTDRLQQLFIQGTRLSLMMIIPVVTALMLLADSLVRAWVGPDFLGSVAVIHILSVAVAIRVGNSAATTLLKGSGKHKLLAFANTGMAIGNIVLSVLFVRTIGLIGVATGTVVALASVSFFVLFPAACRRVGLSVREAVSAAVWPTVWPAMAMAGVLIVLREFLNPSLATVALQAIVGGLVYLLVFFWFAVGRSERQWYMAKARELAARPRATVAAQV